MYSSSEKHFRTIFLNSTNLVYVPKEEVQYITITWVTLYINTFTALIKLIIIITNLMTVFKRMHLVEVHHVVIPPKMKASCLFSACSCLCYNADVGAVGQLIVSVCTANVSPCSFSAGFSCSSDILPSHVTLQFRVVVARGQQQWQN